MTPGLYAIASALDARFNAQEAIAHNLAGSDTIGFRRQTAAFRGFGDALQDAQAPAGGVWLDASHWDLTPGTLRQTGGELDFAIRGDAFFVIQTPQGTRLTRDGHFARNPTSGQLETASGCPVMGERGPMNLPEGRPSLDSEGRLSVDGQTVGQFKLVWPANAQRLSSEGGGLFAVSDPRTLGPARGAQVVTGALETSNVNTPSEMVAMLDNSRLTETITRAMQVADATLGTAIQDLTR
jgi:flagellar basal-body rod protein FlgF